ncbi:MAG: nucleotidyltransferase domain-containing protein [Leptospiraceae bacterium]|nr:nucleotidyltransferase domain-containing protein [Leptospiraceae bacterium]MCP5499632.1 nucleotidyltransferase domain-containing protein [Leptospiraceae bacterium]
MISIEDVKEKMFAYAADKPIKKVYLFGSYARNEMDHESDLDILLELEPEQKVGLLFSRMILDIKEMFPIEVDVISSGALYDNHNETLDFANRIEKDKILIYEK